MNEIPDHVRDGLDVLFIGFNPSLRSAETGHHYANPSNRFWTILQEAGLTPRKYKPDEDGLLLANGYGFTNLVARPTRTAAEITKQEYEEGRVRLRTLLERIKPRIACFVGKGVYEQYSQQKGMPWGKQENPAADGVIAFVVPSSSGLVRMKTSEMAAIYREMLPYVQHRENERHSDNEEDTDE